MSRSGVLLASLVIFLAAPLAARPAPAQPTPRPDLGPGEAVEETDAIFPGAESLDEEGEPRIWAVRIVDARTGLAIPKAVVQVPNHVRRGAAPEDIYYRHVARADRDGWVRVPCKQLEGWRDYIVADAPGYAAEEQCCPDDTECALVAGADVPVVLVDYTGRPVAGARIALNLGCGHIPDQREAATDAAGRAVLRSIYPPRHDDIWVDAPGQHRGTTRLAGTWRPGSPPVLIHTSPGIVVAGRLLLPDGKPWTGALVGPHGFHRPWARTDHEGRFRLAGVSAWSVIEVYATDDEEEPCAQFHAPPEGVERVLVRGAPTSGAPLQVRLRGADGQPAAGVRLAAVRPPDCLTAVAQSDAAGAATFSLPAGRYEILVDGELGEWGTARRDLELEDGSAAATVALEVPRNPTVAVDASRVRGLRLALTTARQFRRLEPEQIDGKRVPVPAGERAVFRVSGEEDGELLVHFIDVPPQSSGDDRPVVLDWLPVTRVTARLRAPDGSAARGRLRIVRERGNPAFETAEPRTESTEAPVARTRLTGTVDWIAVADDAALAPAYGTVALSEPGATVDLGDVRLAPAGGFSLSVETPAALRDKDLRLAVALRRTNYVSVSMNRAGSDGLLRADLRELSWIGTGEQLELSVDEEPAWLPCVVRIESPPPWRVRWPTAELGLRILDAAGHPLTEAAVIADGTLLPLEPDAAGALRLHGLTAGPHEIVVADRRHRARVLRLIFRDGERRDLEVRLRARN